MDKEFTGVVLLICDVWDNHWCKDLRQKTESLVQRINNFANIVRQRGGWVLHCPSGTVDKYYASWPQRTRMKEYPDTEVVVPEEMRAVRVPLSTVLTTGCPDIPTCCIHEKYTKQHDGIEIHSKDLISESGQEVYNFFVHEKIEKVLIAGTALNMCLLGRPFGIEAMVGLRIPIRVMGDLVEIFYSPVEFPYITVEQAKWFTLGYIEAEWCPVTNCRRETQDLPKERNMRIHSNLPGSLMTRLRREHRLKFFVETGTAGGDTTEMAASAFTHVWSCDIDARLVRRAQKRLQDYPNVTISMEPSVDFIKRIKPTLNLPTMFWLDAHWCGGPVKPEKECPLLEELAAIGSFLPETIVARQRKCRWIIVIDDINLIENPPKPPHDSKQWPTMLEVREALDKWKQPYDFDWHEGTNSKLLIVTLRE